MDSRGLFKRDGLCFNNIPTVILCIGSIALLQKSEINKTINGDCGSPVTFHQVKLVE